MKLSQLMLATLLCSASAATAQSHPDRPTRSIELGVKGGGTFTHGFTTIPSQVLPANNVEVPKVENKSNGIGYGYSGGLWARKNFNSFFVQAEVTYNRFVLKQKTNTLLDVNASSTLANALPISVQPGLLNAALHIESESVLEAIDVPILIGKRWMGGKLRGYVGPNFIFVQKAEAKRTTTGTINANPTIGFPQTDIPATTGTTNLLNRYEAQNLEVKDFTYALEIGAGFSPIRFLDVDVRYAVPVGGVYKDSNITGFLGIATVSLGFRVF